MQLNMFILWSYIRRSTLKNAHVCSQFVHVHLNVYVFAFQPSHILWIIGYGSYGMVSKYFK